MSMANLQTAYNDFEATIERANGDHPSSNSQLELITVLAKLGQRLCTIELTLENMIKNLPWAGKGI